ncbi:hypothetical protein CRE_16101 [Caenorhabditis remanei]|uniref:Uncharacterized protein n=1 Tax=Caenorhabditis remanei TaxID=31234 RepID=E3MBU9_CAERE|nr:hypothetical protein CRE_16101 [Caenorhabditis remanei]
MSSPPPPSYLETTIRKCIPKELIPDSWKCDNQIDHKSNIASLLEAGKKQLGMFESSEKLYENVIQYMDFPKNEEHFKMSRSTRVERFPSLPKSIKGQWCMYKNDMYKLFDHHKLSPLQSTTSALAETVLEDCWEKLRVEKHHEMIASPNEPMVPTFGDAQRAALFEPFSSDLMDHQIHWREIANVSSSVIDSITFDSMEKHSGELSNSEAGKVIVWVGLIIRKAEMFAKRGDIHLPPLNSVAPSREVIRLFSSDKNLFVMTHDLIEILQKHDVDSVVLDKLIPDDLKKEKLSTLSYGDALKVLLGIGNKELMNLEFAKMKSDLLMFAQNPIPTHYGVYCIFAVDALYELLMDMIVAKKVFHTFEEKDWEEVNKFFESVKSHFGINRGIYFIDLKEAEDIKKEWEEIYNQHLKRDSKLIQLKKGRFLVNDFMTALKSLKLDKCFGDIVEYAYIIFAKLEKKSPSDMHFAIAHCQINCLARKVPWILEFIERQNSRNRMNIVDVAVRQEEFDVNKLAAELEQMKSEKKQEAKGNVTTKNNTKKK